MLPSRYKQLLRVSIPRCSVQSHVTMSANRYLGFFWLKEKCGEPGIISLKHVCSGEEGNTLFCVISMSREMHHY